MTHPAAPESDTPRTDAALLELTLNRQRVFPELEIVDAKFARQLERELAQAQARIAELEKVLGGIANAKRFDRTIFAGDGEFADWARSIASHALKDRP